MADKLLYENLMTETEAQTEPSAGNDGDVTPAQFAAAASTSASEPGIYGNITNTNTSDIAKTAPKVGFAHSVASKTLPAVLGYVQPMNSPSGFIFAMKKGPAVNQTSVEPFLKGDVDGLNTDLPTPGTATADDLQITRKSVNTGMREVLIDCTNELTEDVQSLFGAEFNDLFKKYLYYDGTDVDLDDPFEIDTNNAKESSDIKLSKFFIEFATWSMSRKTNTDFIGYLSQVATNLGTYDVTTIDEIGNIKGVVAELKDKLYSGTGKTGRTWVLASPKIIQYLLMTNTTFLPDNKLIRKGKRIATSEDYNYVFSSGEVDYYQDINIENKIYCGITGSASTSSIFYTPYKEYFVQGGEDYQTGQSNIWFKLRDAWTTNPLDNGTDNLDSNFIMSADVTFSLGSILA